MADLAKIGKILVIIDCAMVIAETLMNFLGSSVFNMQIGSGSGYSAVAGATNALVGTIVVILIAAVILAIAIGRIEVSKDMLILGVVLLILTLIFTGFLGVLGSLLIILDKIVK